MQHIFLLLYKVKCGVTYFTPCKVAHTPLFCIKMNANDVATAKLEPIRSKEEYLGL